jgi:hypothetical protein
MTGLDRVRTVVAIVRDVLLVALMLAFVFLGARVADAVRDEHAPQVVTPNPAAGCIVPDPENADLCIVSGH